ncbi:MAG: 3-deoxy-manno-octulosonate-8-phosphatase KdsC [Gammaproteobacteria bacterium]
MQDVIDKAKNIKLLILDVDGVLTDAKLFFDEHGREYKAFHTRDGHGIKLLRQCGVEVAVISGRQSPSVALRMHSLGIEYVFQGRENKVAAFEELLQQLAVSRQETAHVGDDLPDLPLMKRAGLGIAVRDAHFAVKEHADWITSLPGGEGAVREVCDFILRAQGHLERLIGSYLE